MPTESIEISGVIPASMQQIYDAFIDGDSHSAMTGSGATSDPVVGGKFTAWDGYIEGEYLELEPPSRIVQTWRTSQFPKGAPVSRLEIRIEEVEGGCKVTFVHSDIPKGQGKNYAEGWQDFYLDPMGDHFGSGS